MIPSAYSYANFGVLHKIKIAGWKHQEAHKSKNAHKKRTCSIKADHFLSDKKTHINYEGDTFIKYIS